jgi:hypothetical protein
MGFKENAALKVRARLRARRWRACEVAPPCFAHARAPLSRTPLPSPPRWRTRARSWS